MPDLLTFVVLSAVTYRLARFFVLDSLINATRDRVHGWLNEPDSISLWRLKVSELLSCPYCITIWISAAVVLFWSAITQWPGWAFLLIWLTTAAGALVFWTYIDSED